MSDEPICTRCGHRLDAHNEFAPDGQPWKCLTQECTCYNFSLLREPRIHPISPKAAPQLVGILNLTPDSFSDGDKFLTPENALKQALQLIEDGADILDIGAESTRPGAQAISPEQEWARLEEPLKAVIGEIKAPISLDTRHASNLEKALNLRSDLWINDVSGLSSPEMQDLVKSCRNPIILMHNLGVPADPKQVLAANVDPIDEILKWAEKTIVKLDIDDFRVILDPGLGFGKRREQNIQILEQAHRLKTLRLPVLIGHSRKGFLASCLKPEDRDEITVHWSRHLTTQGVDFLRVHNVAAHRKTF